MTLQKRDEALLAIANPKQMVAFYTEIANELSAVVESKGLYTVIQGKKFLQAEAWETIIALDGANPIIEYCVPIRDGDELLGWEAKARIEKNGEIQATGIMVCGVDDFPCRGKTGLAMWRAGMSSAQTWAMAKAGRQKYAWVVTLAGYAPTPADEMTEFTPTSQQPRRRQSTPASDSNLMCPVHNIEFFKRGKMKNFAHKNDDDTWCNQDDVAKAAPAASAPDSAEHYCAEHERRQALDGQGRWYHQIGDQEFWCVAGVGVMNAQGELVPDGTGDSEAEE
jgi:hypothetical protein